jgi:hypothetical protein
MGAKTSVLIYSMGNPSEVFKKEALLNETQESMLDREATITLAKKLFPSEKLVETGDPASLSDADASGDTLLIGCFPGLAVVSADECGLDYPSRLPAAFVEALPNHTVYLHAMHSVVDWFAYAIWKDGTLQRSLSLSANDGLIENKGNRLSFEEPYWQGLYPVGDDEEDEEEYPFVFHPLELAEAALLTLFGYELEGVMDEELRPQFNPEMIPLMCFKRET